MVFNLEVKGRSCRPVPTECDLERGRCCLMDNEMCEREMGFGVGANI